MSLKSLAQQQVALRSLATTSLEGIPSRARFTDMKRHLCLTLFKEELEATLGGSKLDTELYRTAPDTRAGFLFFSFF